MLFSVLGIYLDIVMPDAMGAKKPLLYLFAFNYWGFGNATVEDKIEEIPDDILSQSTDDDVLDEERVSQQRMGQYGNANKEWVIDVRGLQQRFVRQEKGPGDWYSKDKPFWAVIAPWFGIGRCAVAF